MSDVTHILSQIEQGDASAAEQLLPLVYDELRKLAAARMAHEQPGQTLQATALVHEAYLRLVDGSAPKNWNSRGHFFASAAEAMRRILVDSARRKQSIKHGGGLQRQTADDQHLGLFEAGNPAELLAIHEVVDLLAEKSPRKAELVKLRYFLGCTLPEAAEVLGISQGTAEDDWTYAKAWLRRRLQSCEERTSHP